jgi:Mg/Co/Ni transporter MgtE
MIATRSLEDVEELIRKGDFAALRETLEDLPLADVADLLTHLPPHEQVAAFCILPPRHLASFWSPGDDANKLMFKFKERDEHRTRRRLQEPSDV